MEIKIKNNSKYEIIAHYIKDLSFEIPSSESFVNAAQNLDKYEAKIDISNKPLKNGMLELNCKIFFEAPKEIIDKIHAEICMAIIFKIIDTQLNSEEIKRIILAEIPDLYGKNMTDLITDLFHKSGFKEFKFKKDINFAELYEQQFSNLKQKN
jgi:preprotein translocase subunit SecB